MTDTRALRAYRSTLALLARAQAPTSAPWKYGMRAWARESLPGSHAGALERTSGERDALRKHYPHLSVAR